MKGPVFVKGALSDDFDAIEGAQAVSLRPKKFGGSWLPRAHDINSLLEACPQLRALEVPGEHARELHRFGSLRELVITGTRGPDCLNLGEIRDLRALTTTWAKGIEGWSRLKHLRALSIHYCEWPDLEALEASFQSLRSLTLKSSRVKDLRALANCGGLEFLHVSGGAIELECGWLGTLSHLKSLYLDGVRPVGLAQTILTRKLRWLVLDNVGELESLRFLRKARPDMVGIGGRGSVVVDGGLRFLVSSGVPCVMVDKMHPHYDVKKAELPNGDVSPPVDPYGPLFDEE